MDDPLTDHDSPLSITSSVTGILTFLVAIVAAAYVRIIYLRDSDEEYFKVKTSLSWFKKESTWLRELVQATGHIDRSGLGMSAEQYMQTAEYQMYAFVMDDLARLEQRLLDVVAETEEAAGESATEEGEQWPLVPRSWGWTRTKTTVAMAWLPVRRKALELVRQRDALTARVLFTQMSMLTSYAPALFLSTCLPLLMVGAGASATSSTAPP
ncbi:hypothetical protein GQ53DRAFT_20584 [Thozetella sp. PMI_491]|nr:hypothetical protein GQ53DRAFT_20584 [Thozetella sp. PMI_491]